MILEYKKFIDKKIDKDFLLKKIKNVENFKPSLEFDKIYGTTLSQEYKYPFDLTCDEVWNIIDHGIEYYDRYKKDSKQFSIVLDNLSSEHFPYADFEILDRNTKTSILLGMSSCFNFNDIVWFSVNDIYYSTNHEVNAEVDNLPKDVKKDIQWVISPNTLLKMKAQLKELEII